MWTKSIIPPLLLIIQFLAILQISFGKPTAEKSVNRSSTTTEPVDTDVREVREDGDVNPSFLETVSVLLTVLSSNDNVTAEEDSTFPLNNITANYTTTEPEYYDDHNLTTSSSTLNELDAVEDDELSMLGSSVHLGSSTESSSLLSSLITEEMEVADSLDESVTATMLTLIGDGKDVNGANDDDDNPSRPVDNGDIIQSKRESGSLKSTPSATDDSIIIASMSSNLNLDTVEPLSSHADVPSEEEIISSSRLLYDSSTSSSAPEPAFYSATDATTIIHE